MIAYKDIRNVHLEISTLCNARCPLCPRNFRGYPYNDGYPEINMTLDNAKKIFTTEFLKQLTSMKINGNFGDMVMNPESVDIIDYFLAVNPTLDISISTNASARTAEFWRSLARPTVSIEFCIDGLADTHTLYRQNTSWDTIIKNAKEFISAGGNATWKYIIFDHNKHQVTACQDLATDMGFNGFKLIKNPRTDGPVFDKNGKHTHNIGNYTGDTNFKTLFFKKKRDLILVDDIVADKIPKNKINCWAKERQSIYISANGDIAPCCWIGFYPRTYGHGEYHQAVNSQVVKIMTPNNALEQPIEDCISWFNSVEKSWELPTYTQGRLIACDDECGS